jgi:hypothetical protein
MYSLFGVQVMYIAWLDEYSPAQHYLAVYHISSIPLLVQDKIALLIVLSIPEHLNKRGRAMTKLSRSTTPILGDKSSTLIPQVQLGTVANCDQILLV